MCTIGRICNRCTGFAAMTTAPNAKYQRVLVLAVYLVANGHCCCRCCCFSPDSVADVGRRRNVTSRRNVCTLRTAASPERRQESSRGACRPFRRTAQRGAAAHDADADDDDFDFIDDDDVDDVELDDEVFDRCETWLRDVAAANRQPPDPHCS